MQAIIVLLAMAWVGGAQAAAPVSCNISSAVTAFGAYTPTSPANLDMTGSLTVSCTKAFSAVLRLGVGNGAGASYSGGRKMTRIGGGSTLTYNLYADAGRTKVLGDGTGGSFTLNISGKSSKTQSIWGRIRGSQVTVLSGGYADTVVATISY